MKTSISGRFLDTRIWCGIRRLSLAALIILTSVAAYAQTTVTTLTDANHGKAGYKDGYTFSQAQFRFPAGIALDPSGENLFLADFNNNAIREITSVGIDNKLTSITRSVYTNKDGINHPISIAIDSATNIYVLNQGTTTKGKASNGTILEFSGSYLFDYNLKYLIATNATHLTNATAMALDYSDNIYVTVQSNTVLRITPLGSNSVVGVITNKGTSLRGIVVTQSGLLALTDAGNNGIWLMDPSNTTNTFGNSFQFTGFHGAADLPGPSNIAAFNSPQNIAKAGGGILVVTDYKNGEVKQIATNGSVSLLYGVAPKYWKKPYAGWRDGTLNDANETIVSVQARQPYGVVVAHDGTVYITETYYNLLREATATGLPVLPPPPLAAPTIYSAVTNLGSVTLTWSPVDGADSYNVRRSQDGTNYTVFANTTGTTYTDTNVIGGATYYYIITAVNSGGEGAFSGSISATAPYAPAPDPQIGYVTFIGTSNLSVLTPVTVYTMNSYTPIVIEEPKGPTGNQLVYAYAATTNPAPPNFHPGKTGYTDGLTSVTNYDIYSTIQQYPDVTVWAMASGGIPNVPSSSIVSARFIFVAAEPTIGGNNAAAFTVTDPLTPGAYYYYTVDGSDPSPTNGTFISSTPATNSIAIQADTLLKVKAYYANYQASETASNLFTLSSYKPNIACFGFASGPGSSQFVASPGQSFVVPVGVDLLDSTPPIYGLQFNLTVTNLGSHAVAPGDVDFVSLLGKPDAYGDGYYVPIPPLMFVSSNQPPSNDSGAFQTNGDWYQGLTFNDTNNFNLLGVGWLEIYGRTNLYDTLSQNLLSTTIAFGTDITATNTGTIVGGYIFGIPTNADVTDIYQIQIGRPSATTFSGIGSYGDAVSIDAPASTNLLGPGSESALKDVTIGQIKYLVGNVTPANWYNAGDFGSSNLINLDVERVFDLAVYPIATPPVSSDLFDAMDSCGNYGYISDSGYYTNASIYPFETNFVNAVTNYTYVYDTNGAVVDQSTAISDYSSQIGQSTYTVSVPYFVTNIDLATPPALPTTNVIDQSYNISITPSLNLFNGNDTNINQIAFGDGVLDVCDVYVTYRRSLDSSLLWFERFWTNGVRAADNGIPNHADHVAAKIAISDVQPQVKAQVVAKSSVPPLATFTAGTIHSSAGKVVKVPITVTVAGIYPLRLLMLNLNVVPLNGAPELTTSVTFTQSASVLGAPYPTDSMGGNGDYTAVWLNSGNNGILGTATIGTLTVTIPAHTPSGAAYGIFFDHASASPNGLASFPIQTVTGTIFCK